MGGRGMAPGILSFRNLWKMCGKAGSGPGRGAEGAVGFIWGPEDLGSCFGLFLSPEKPNPKRVDASGISWNISLIQAGIPGWFPSLQWGGAELARDDFVGVFLEILGFDPKFQRRDEEESLYLSLGRNPSGFVES